MQLGEVRRARHVEAKPRRRRVAVAPREALEGAKRLRVERVQLRVQLRRPAERGRPGEQQHAPRRLEQRQQHLGALRVAALDALALVAHDDAEGGGRQRRGLPRDEVVRDDHDRRARRDGRRAAREHHHVVRREQRRQPAQQLVAPVQPRRGGARHEERPLVDVRGRRRDRLHRLAEAHLVGEQHSALPAQDEGDALLLVARQRGTQRRGHRHEQRGVIRGRRRR